MSTHTNRYISKDGHLLRRRLSPEREEEISPLRSLLAADVPVCLATYNVPVSMFWPIWQSVSRRCLYSEDPIAPGQALTREQALRCATNTGAYLTFDEDKKGSLEAGKLADLFVANLDPLTVAEEELPMIDAHLTIVGGKVVFERREDRSECRASCHPRPERSGGEGDSVASRGSWIPFPAAPQPPGMTLSRSVMIAGTRDQTI